MIAPELEFAPSATDFESRLNAAALEYQDGIEREATQAEHERAELFCQYVDILHAQDADRVDELLDIAHRLSISTVKAKADFGVIAEANHLEALAKTKDDKLADYEAAAKELISWRESFNAELFKRMQAVNAANALHNEATDAVRNRTTLLNSHPELFPSHRSPASDSTTTNTNDVPEGFERVQDGTCGPCLRKLPDPDPAAA